MDEQRTMDERGPRDDVVIPFRTEASGISGRLVRLGGTAHDILSRHDYPPQVNEVLGEALALTAMLGTQIKFDGKLIVQSRSDGPLGFFVTHYQAPGRIRGYASFDAEGLKTVDAAAKSDGNHGRILGEGYLALTIDQGRDMDRYQGIVPLTSVPLSEAARTYFRQSEQLPTYIRLAVARHRDVESDTGWRWRAGGIMVQHVAPEGGRPPPKDAPDDFLLGDDDDHWQRVNLLAATVEDHELLDPTLSPERLLVRLFHEEGVRVFEDRALESYCQCSRERIGSFLGTFQPGELADMRTEAGDIEVTCEFCCTSYRFDERDLKQT